MELEGGSQSVVYLAKNPVLDELDKDILEQIHNLPGISLRIIVDSIENNRERTVRNRVQRLVELGLVRVSRKSERSQAFLYPTKMLQDLFGIKMGAEP
jgi:hypothetical protein